MDDLLGYSLFLMMCTHFYFLILISADGNNLYVTRFAWIPGHLLDLIYVSDPEIT